jgi:hypothetical protein
MYIARSPLTHTDLGDVVGISRLPWKVHRLRAKVTWTGNSNGNEDVIDGRQMLLLFLHLRVLELERPRHHPVWGFPPTDRR